MSLTFGKKTCSHFTYKVFERKNNITAVCFGVIFSPFSFLPKREKQICNTIIIQESISNKSEMYKLAHGTSPSILIAYNITKCW